MNRVDYINTIAQKIQAKKYLEIGVDDASICYDNIIVEEKIGVDPAYNDTHKDKGILTITSDAFFDSRKDFLGLDLAFLDGLHHWDQLVRDVKNTISHMNSKGVVVCHDTFPRNEYMQTRVRETGEWTGDVWKAVLYLRYYANLRNTFTIYDDYGCFVIVVDKSRFNYDIPDVTDDLFKYISDMKYEVFKEYWSDVHGIVIHESMFVETLNKCLT